jgi:hypothetical protein
MTRKLFLALLFLGTAAATTAARPKAKVAPTNPYIELRHGTSSVTSDGDFWKVRVDVLYSSDKTGYVTVDLWDDGVDDWERCYTLTELGEPTTLYAWEVSEGLVGKQCVAYFEWKVPKASAWGEAITAGVPVSIWAQLWRNGVNPNLEDTGIEYRD